MKKRNKKENDKSFFGLIIKIIFGIVVIIGLFYLYLALTK